MKEELKTTVRWFPELGRFEPGKPRRAAWKRASKEVTGTGLGIIKYLVLMTLVMGTVIVLVQVLWHVIQQYFLPHVTLPHYITSGIAGGIAGPLSIYATIWFGRRRIQQSLRRQLIEAGLPACLKCGYDLRGLLEPRCPECGVPFDPALLAGDDSETIE